MAIWLGDSVSWFYQ